MSEEDKSIPPAHNVNIRDVKLDQWHKIYIKVVESNNSKALDAIIIFGVNKIGCNMILNTL